MNIDFENALQQEPVQAVMMVMMKYLTDEQRKIVYEKLGRRVDQSLPDEAALKAEAERLYEDELNVYFPVEEFTYNDLQKEKRAAHIEASRKWIGRVRELEAEVADLNKIIQREFEAAKLKSNL